MDIWLTTCKKKAKCSYCEELIELGEPVVYGRLWLRTKEGEYKPRRFVKRFRWHAQKGDEKKCCWLEQALNNLANNPYIETRGRKRLVLPPEIREKRLKVLRRRAKVVQQLRTETEEQPERQDIDEIIRLGGILARLKEEIEPLGGVPKGW